MILELLTFCGVVWFAVWLRKQRQPLDRSAQRRENKKHRGRRGQ